ncbi:MAG: type II toxin-antitoxin system VapC family toxin [Candidatus Zixiibacteriota bacterium]
MNFILDTCIISELVKPKPNSKVIKWVSSCPEETLYLSTLTIGEIQKGISILPESHKKDDLEKWLNQDLMRRFDRRIVGIDIKVAQKWGEIQAQTEKKGVKMPVVDSLIAATGLVHDMTVVTRNVDDMKSSSVTLFNPWKN